MLNHAGLSQDYWAEAINTAVYIRNRCTSNALDDNKTMPNELWTGKKANVHHFRIFGCDAYTLDNNYRQKLDPKAKKYIFIGYEHNGTYRLWDPFTEESLPLEMSSSMNTSLKEALQRTPLPL